MFKGFPAEGGIRAPLIVKLPGPMANAGTMNHSFVHVRDIMPTILQAAGIEPVTEIAGRSVHPIQGKSILEFLQGTTETPYPGADEVGYELFGLKAYFDGDRKILQMPPPFGNGSWQLYDLEADTVEQLTDFDVAKKTEVRVAVSGDHCVTDLAWQRTRT